MMRALVTGCTSGFGAAIVERLLEQGAHVAATGRSVERITVENRGRGRLERLKLDITSRSDRIETERFVRTVFEGRLDCLINNAGQGLFGPLELCTEDEVAAVLETNLVGTVQLTRQLLPSVRGAKGRILFLSSLLGFAGMPLASVYSASKFGLEGLAECLSYELAPYGVQVCLVEPGAFATRFGDNLRWPSAGPFHGGQYAEELARAKARSLEKASAAADPDEVVRLVLRLLSQRRMPLRARAGSDSHGVHLLRRALPAGLYHRLTSVVFRRAFGPAPSDDRSAAE